MKVLLAEDDAVSRHLTDRVIRECGHEVVAARDGQEAMDLYLREPTPILVLDWQMPHLDGIEVCRLVRTTPTGRDAFVLMLSARDGREDLARAIEAGVDDYITKPATPEQITFRLAIAARRVAVNEARRLAEQELEAARWAAGAHDTIVALQHEINNPLAALLTTLDLASDPATTVAEYRSAIATSLHQTRRIVTLMRKVSALRQHRRTEYLPGVPMLDVTDE